MPDLPFQSLLSQSRAHALSAEQLESIGKSAAADWVDRKYLSLTEAVTDTIKLSSVPLTTEQVRRVVEFANTEAYLSEFRKEGEHKIVDFGPTGPANPADVLRNLNAIGGMAVKDSGLEDYRRLPKKHSSHEGLDFDSLFPTKTASGYPEENPYSDVEVLREKLSSAYALVTDQLGRLETAYLDLGEHLYGAVKQAALAGTSLGEIVQSWSAISEEPEFVKAAFDLMVPRFFNEGIFSTLDEASASLMKTAGARTVNVEHPVVQHYADFCSTLAKLAELREQQEEYRDGYEKLSSFLGILFDKKASTVGELMRRGAQAVEGSAAKHLKTGPATSKLLGLSAGYALPALGAYGAYRYGKDLAEDVGITRHIPGTPAYQQMRMERQMGGWM